ncbi:hypothetical protein CRE_26745 [Caenorhabditis remanei]|uniref:RING-type E3 ubiquitin transferase n=1 Tax=Caenorhabditis remanei TaxID=31234 RepID=E3MXT7_CAERE|nr:hypothetical protein CRE_26745 [Caenorhabditis remanei]
MRRQPPPQQPIDCRYFANGICSKGNACTFIHDAATRNENICQFNLVGKCSFGQACRFLHTRPKNDECPSTSSPSSSSSSSKSKLTATVITPRVRPIQLAQPGLNVDATEFVPSWMKKSEKSVGNATQPPISYAAAASSRILTSSEGGTSSPGGSTSSSNSPLTADAQMCPYHLKNGDCNRKDFACPFAHGDLCDMCHQWCLHPTNQELRKLHQNECLESHTQEMERAFMLQKTEQKTCGICMENVLHKNLRFGILNGCQHCFCLDCIRQWRTRDQQSVDLDTKTVRSCPECRQHSDFVIPSLFWVENGEEKDLLIEMYKENMRAKVCKYYTAKNVTRGQCPFGNKCFYKHQLPDGSIDPGESPHARRRFNVADFLFDLDDSDDDTPTSGYVPFLAIGSDDREGYTRFLAEMELDTPDGDLFRRITAMARHLTTRSHITRMSATAPPE